MSSTQHKSAKVRNAVKVALGAAVAAPLLFAVNPATSAEIQMGETTVEIGGFVRMDAFYDFEQASGPSLEASDAVASSHDNDGNFGSSAQYTRLTFSFDTPTSAGNIGGYIEADFFGSTGPGGSYGDSSNLNLRKAYLTYGNWLIGQTDSAFANDYLAPVVDWANPEGDVGSDRTPQVRYTVDLGNGDSVAVALEEDLGPDESAANTDPRGNTPLPALAAKYTGQSGIFSYQAAAIVRELEIQNGPTQDNKLGWGVNIGASAAFDSGTSLFLQATYGQGINSYMGIHGSPFNGIYYDASGDASTADTTAVVLGVSQQFTDTIAASLAYGYGHIKADNYNTNGDAKTRAQSAEVALFYSPVDSLTFGAEYKYVDRKDTEGSIKTFDGDANRLVFSTTYAF